MFRSISYIFLLCTLLTGAVKADEVTLVADRYYPYNGIPSSPQPGYMIEIARYAFESAGHTVKYQLMAWSRAIELVEQGKKSCIVAGFKSDAPNLIFPDIHQGVDEIAMFTRADSDWQYQGVTSLQGKRLGVIDNYAYEDEIDRYIAQYKGTEWISAARGKFALEHNLTSLINGEIDVVIESRPVVQTVLKKLKLQGKILFAGSADKLSKNYIACSPALANGAEYAQLIAKATEELRASGELEKILNSYGLTDWVGSGAIDN